MPGRPATRSYRLASSVGTWHAVFTEWGLRELRLPGISGDPALPADPPLTDQEGAWGERLQKALALRLKRRAVGLPWELFDLRERPPFFVRVWKAMHGIPFGSVRTYAQMAEEAGSPAALRAAGQACGSNPIVLFIPCHRVVAANGPGGFGAGLDWKYRLLALEGVKLDGLRSEAP